jgi:hypothetical protein
MVIIQHVVLTAALHVGAFSDKNVNQAPSTAVNRVLEVKGTRLLQCDQEIIIPGLNLSAKHCGKSLAASGSYIVIIVALCHSCCCAHLYE